MADDWVGYGILAGVVAIAAVAVGWWLSTNPLGAATDYPAAFQAIQDMNGGPMLTNSETTIITTPRGKVFRIETHREVK